MCCGPTVTPCCRVTTVRLSRRDSVRRSPLPVPAKADPADHDWVFRHPRLFVDRLEGLGLSMFETGRRVPRISAR